jgi:hypothetical protein
VEFPLEKYLGEVRLQRFGIGRLTAEADIAVGTDHIQTDMHFELHSGGVTRPSDPTALVLSGFHILRGRQVSNLRIRNFVCR